MAIVIGMPKLSDTMEDGGIANWLKKEGEAVAEGEALVEIETDKATMEYQSPEAGYLLNIIVPAGTGSGLGEPIAVLGDKNEKIDLKKLLGTKQKDSPREATPKQPQQNELESTTSTQQRSASDTTSAHTSITTRIKASPLARRIAQERNIELESISGSGPQGRIIARDVESGQPSSGKPTRIALSTMRKTIAKRLVKAKNEIPHYYLKRTINVEQLIAGRKEVNTVLPPEQKISFNDIISFMCIKALLKHPQVNTAWDNGQEIIQYNCVNLAIAVALPDGLITPVVNNSEQLGLVELSAAIRTLVGKAKSNSLSPADYTGGTFTISNLGMYGVEEFSAIINPPQAAILAVGTAVATPQVTPSGQIISQKRVALTLSCDHRLIDGALGAQFLATLANYLENPLLALLYRP